MNIPASELKPGDRIEVAGEWWTVKLVGVVKGKIGVIREESEWPFEFEPTRMLKIRRQTNG